MDAPSIHARKGPDFGLDGDIPRYWLEGDAFKSRFFDALSCLFPDGERFFIACVRDFREDIQDPELQAQVKDFIYQEGQHGQVHTQYNNRLKAQGVDVDRIIAKQHRILFDFMRKKTPKTYTLGQTAAAEHVTALMAHSFFDSGVMRGADPRMRAVFAWHAIEEIEHKAVAFDVYQKVAGGGYLFRVLSMLQVAISFPLHTLLIMRHMFKVDGLPNRGRVWLKGLWWLYGPRGMFTRLLPHFAVYFLPGFHPWKHGSMATYEKWQQVYTDSGDPIAAGNAAAGV
ncbi:MAG: metal-dependent hydrolase [Oceanococcaceae bacterium]